MLYAAIMVPLGLNLLVCGMLIGRNHGNDRRVGQCIAGFSATIAAIGFVVIQYIPPTL